MLRKLYASLSYTNFANPKPTNFNTWVSNVLGHGDMLTSFSYSWVNVADPEEIKAEGIKTELEELRRKIYLYLNIKGAESESENEDDDGKYKPLGKKASREDKFELLNKIWNDYGGKITNTALRKISGVGAVIVNDFVRSKKETTTEETKQTTEETTTKQTEETTTEKKKACYKLIDENGVSQPIRRSTRLKKRKTLNKSL